MNQFHLIGEINQNPKYEQTESGVPYVDLLVDTTTKAIVSISGPDFAAEGGGIFQVRVMNDAERTGMTATEVQLHKGDLVRLSGHIMLLDMEGKYQPELIATEVEQL